MAPDPKSPLPSDGKIPTPPKRKKPSRVRKGELGIATLMGVTAALLYVYGHPEAAEILGLLSGVTGMTALRPVKR